MNEGRTSTLPRGPINLREGLKTDQASCSDKTWLIDQISCIEVLQKNLQTVTTNWQPDNQSQPQKYPVINLINQAKWESQTKTEIASGDQHQAHQRILKKSILRKEQEEAGDSKKVSD